MSRLPASADRRPFGDGTGHRPLSPLVLRAQPEITAMIDMKNNYALPKL